MKTRLALFLTVLLAAPSMAGGQEVTDLLGKMQSATVSTTYQGTLTTVIVNTPCPKIYQYKIVNYGNLQRQEEMLTDGIEKEISYDDGRYLWRFFPHRNLIIKERSCQTRLVSEQITENLELLRQNYAIKVAGIFNLNGRNGYRICFTPKSDDRPQQIYWIDGETGLPFKIEKYGPERQLVSVSSFSEIDFGVPGTGNSFLKVPSETLVREVNAQGNLTLGKALGLMGSEILLPAYLPSGFIRKDICVKNQGGKKVLQFFYTDGLSSLSLFERPFNEKYFRGLQASSEKARIDGIEHAFLRTSGALNTLTVASRPLTSTLIGEIFKNQITKVAVSLKPANALQLGSELSSRPTPHNAETAAPSTTIGNEPGELVVPR